MHDFESSHTFENLKRSFEDEAKLYFRYKYFLTVASYEGMEETVKLLENLAESSLDNVLGSLDFLREFKDPASMVPIGRTSQNISSLLQTEIEQASEMYPRMARLAREEGFTDMASWFDTLEKVKRVHVQKLKKAKDD